MKNKFSYITLTVVASIIASLCACNDELEGIVQPGRATDVLCFSVALSDGYTQSKTRSAKDNLEMEEEEWALEGVQTSGAKATRGTPTTLLSGSAGLSGYVYNEWNSSTTPWTELYNKQYDFDGDQMTAHEADVRWSIISKQTESDSVRFYLYAPYNLSGGTISGSLVGGAPKIAYTVNDNVEDQHDLIVASWQGTKGTHYGPKIQTTSIPLVFDHALTAVRFKVGFDCIVTRLEVQNVYNSGTYAFDTGWSVDMAAVEGQSATTSYSFDFDDKQCKANDLITDGETTLMMIPQTLPATAKVILTYKETSGGEPQTITATIGGKVWQEGKMITYTIHETTAPTTIYFDLAAGNVLICPTENQSNQPTATATYSGYVYVNGEPVKVSGDHYSSNVYYVYQSTGDISGGNDKTKTGWSKVKGIGECTLPNYSPVTYNDKPWADFIRNNTSVAGVIQAWNEAANTVARESTSNRIQVYGSGIVVNLTIDNIYTNYAERSVSRTKAGIGFNAGSNSKLTITTIGDNRVSAIHYYGGINQKNQLIFEGTGSLTVCAASGNTEFYNDTYVGEENENDTTFIDNHWCSAIGGNDSGEGNSCGIVINSGNIFAGTTKAENCTAIGAGGNDRGVITINGGNVTAVATTTGTAIGGGIGYNSAGGYGIITINGGNVYAYNHQNRWSIPSSAIGGAGSSAAAGTQGDVYINGGYVYAYSALGTAIGGGSSKTNKGGNANITITGGQIIAKSASGTGIGGGTGSAFDNNNNGGNATITISGNPIIRTGSIGGGGKGPQSTGTIGAANIVIKENCEADIQAQFVLAAGIASGAENKFEMKGGTIRNSYADDKEYLHIQKKGGAVYLEEGTFIMSGGTIKNCSAEQGGAVYVNSQSGTSTFTMTDGEIHSCFATGTFNQSGTLTGIGNGGAVYLNGGTVTMKGGKIWNNYSVNGHGGAAYISNGSFFMQEGMPEISGNAAQKGNGGGVYISSSDNSNTVKVELLKGSITDSTAINYGGGACVDMGTTDNEANVIVGQDGQGFTATDADPKITGNISGMSGGGLYVRGGNADVTINSGMIDGNDVSAYVKNDNVANEGGRVLLNNGLVTHVEVTFDGNGGVVSGSDKTSYKQKIVTNTNSYLTANTFTRGGYVFNGWNTRADGRGTDYGDKQLMNISENITLFAKWKAQSY